MERFNPPFRDKLGFALTSIGIVFLLAAFLLAASWIGSGGSFIYGMNFFGTLVVAVLAGILLIYISRFTIKDEKT